MGPVKKKKAESKKRPESKSVEVEGMEAFPLAPSESGPLPAPKSDKDAKSSS